MSSISIPVSLTDQAADFIRKGLLQNRWTGTLPTEADLCKELGISRGTLRRALAALFAEGGLVPGGRGGRHGIGARPKISKESLHLLNSDVVRLLSPQPRYIITDQTQLIFHTMAEILGRSGLRFEFEFRKSLAQLRRPASLLRKTTSGPRTAAWVLYRSTHAVQEWFARSKLPAFVLGGVYSEIPLPNAEFDHDASCRHAAGIFASRGHRRMVFLSVENATAGDKSSARSFMAAAAAAGVDAEVAIHDDTVPGLCRVLDGLLLSHEPPTAFLVGFSNHVYATIGHLRRRGVSVPGAAAVISRMDSLHLAESIPTIARYKMDCERLARTAARAIRKLIHPVAPPLPVRHVILPEYVDGETACRRQG
jgi:hypothetical protein